MDYALSTLSPRDFEHVVQSLALTVLGGGVTPFGDGPDGGREATFDGPTPYPSPALPWAGYVVIQCKCRIGEDNRDGDSTRWALDQLRTELNKYGTTSRARRAPEYFILATNVRLSAVQKSGGKDRVLAALNAAAKRFGWKGVALWSYDELCRFLDADDSVRSRYFAFLATGDVLAALHRHVAGVTPDFSSCVRSFIQKEFLADTTSRLDSHGLDVDQTTHLARVFEDLPALRTASRSAESWQRERPDSGITNLLLRTAAQTSRALDTGKGKRAEDPPPLVSGPRFAIVGGPGQGKSTIGQFLCQAFRAALLSEAQPSYLTDRTKAAIEDYKVALHRIGATLPVGRRFPLRLVLNQFAADLAREPSLTVLEYIRRLIESASHRTLTIEAIHVWLGVYPWLVVFDGLDEVPPSSNRADVLRQLQDFFVDIQTASGDVVVVGTTRPQGYNNELRLEHFEHWYLSPLDASRALAYGSRLISGRWGTASADAQRYLSRLTRAIENPMTARLMTTPLQVSIMTVLVERFVEPPEQRYRLFQEYYNTIYAREQAKEGGLAQVLVQRRRDVDIVHYRAGLHLQARSEHTGGTDAHLSDDEFRRILIDRLDDVGISPAEQKELVRQIADTAIDRLVFLVRAVAGAVSFELRSLQEFMAAEAILDGDQSKVVERLRALAGLGHWRNVFLFAVGRCFAKQEHLLPDIYTRARELNLEGNGGGHAISKWGSRLALDIVVEGSSKANPRFERLFLELALETLATCDSSCGSKLAQAYRPEFEEMFADTLRRYLAEAKGSPRTAAMACVVDLVGRGDATWADGLLAEFWSSATKDLDGLAEVAAIEIPSGFGPPVADAVANGLCSPWLMLPVGWRKAVPDWCIALSEYLSVVARLSKDQGTRWQIGGHAVPLDWIPVAGPHNDYLSRIRRSRRRMPAWAPITLSAQASLFTSHAGLADGLESLAREYGTFASRSRAWYVPWPIAMCLGAARSTADLEALSARMRRGELGDVRAWNASERGWRGQVLSVSEFRRSSDARWPVNIRDGQLDFPIAAVLPGRVSEEACPALWEEYAWAAEHETHSMYARWLAIWIRNSLREHGADPMRGAEVNVRVTRRWLEDCLRWDSALDGTAIAALNVDWSAAGEATVAIRDVIREHSNGLRLFTHEVPSDTLAQWLTVYRRAPIDNKELQGLLYAAAVGGSAVEFTRGDLETAAANGLESARLATLVLYCAGPDVTCEEAQLIGARIAALSQQSGDLLDPVDRFLESGRMKPGVQEALCSAMIRGEAYSGGSPWIGRARVEARLVDAMLRESSGLSSVTRWDEWGLKCSMELSHI